MCQCCCRSRHTGEISAQQVFHDLHKKKKRLFLFGWKLYVFLQILDFQKYQLCYCCMDAYDLKNVPFPWLTTLLCISGMPQQSNDLSLCLFVCLCACCNSKHHSLHYSPADHCWMDHRLHWHCVQVLPAHSGHPRWRHVLHLCRQAGNHRRV